MPYATVAVGFGRTPSPTPEEDPMSNYSLDASLRAGTVSVEDLVERVADGQYRIPKFQRPLRWRASNIRDLFDSIWNNYPIGTLLLWKRAGPAEKLSLGRLAIKLSHRSDAMYVVDGQQRIAALANVLLHSGPTRSTHDIWALWFDLKMEKVLTGVDLREAEAGGAVCIPLNVVLDAVRLQTWCTEQGLVGDPELFRKALLLGL